MTSHRRTSARVASPLLVAALALAASAAAQDAQDEAAQDEAASDEAASDEAASDSAASAAAQEARDDAARDDAARDDAARDDAARDDAARAESAPADTAPGDTAVEPAPLDAAPAPLDAAPTSAVEGLAGSVSAHLLASTQPDFGGALGADLWYANGIFRIGGFFGVGAVPSPDDVHNRVFMPLAVSAGVEVLGPTIGFSLRARGGVWGGATQAVKITAGGFLGASAYLLFRLGAGVGLGVGLDVWGLLGDGETVLFAPGLGLSWTPAGAP